MGGVNCLFCSLLNPTMNITNRRPKNKEKVDRGTSVVGEAGDDIKLSCAIKLPLSEKSGKFSML